MWKAMSSFASPMSAVNQRTTASDTTGSNASQECFGNLCLTQKVYKVLIRRIGESPCLTNRVFLGPDQSLVFLCHLVRRGLWSS